MIRQTLAVYPKLTASRLYEMVRERGYGTPRSGATANWTDCRPDSLGLHRNHPYWPRRPRNSQQRPHARPGKYLCERWLRHATGIHNLNSYWPVRLIETVLQFQRKSQALQGSRRRIADFHAGLIRHFDP